MSPPPWKGMPPTGEVDLEDPQTASRLASGDWEVFRLRFRELTPRLRALRSIAGERDEG